ncbi:MAG: hypothetical protein PVF91_12140 [Chromatiales bacterium]|jgi:hypothetical protein
MMPELHSQHDKDHEQRIRELEQRFSDALAQLEVTRPFAKSLHIGRVLDQAARLLKQPGGVQALFGHAHRFDGAGVFAESDWAAPERLQPALVELTLRGEDRAGVILECLNELRMLGIATGRFLHPAVPAERAQEFLNQVLALNLDYVFHRETEAARAQASPLQQGVYRLFDFIVATVGYENIIDQAADEAWRILKQRPIRVDDVKAMVTRMSVCYADPDIATGDLNAKAHRLISALYGPTHGCEEDPGFQIYGQRLLAMDEQFLRQEALGFARAMHDTGLVSPYHTVFLRHVLSTGNIELISMALGLSPTGYNAMLTYRELSLRLIEEAVFAETPQVVLGLAMILERGVLYAPAVAPALWRQIGLQLSPEVRTRLHQIYGEAVSAEARLLAGVIDVLGLPLGIGQGHNPTCQSARAISLWAYSVPDYLLQLITWAARDGEVIMHFEGEPISSLQTGAGLAPDLHPELDPVSLLLVPHLDRIYMEMGRRVVARDEDAHKWVNPEFHGWRVGRGFAIAVDVPTGAVLRLDRFLRHFYAMYHPGYNGGTPVIFPQPAGIAVTDASARFVGWHAITILRVTVDAEGVMRVYFFNPNNDSVQHWGQDIQTSIEGHGEFFGESSLPIEQFAARLYLFHFDPLEEGSPERVPVEEIGRIEAKVRESWGAEREWIA